MVVPFGNTNRERVGLVLAISSQEEGIPQGIKYVLSVEDARPIFDQEQIQLVHWLREHTFCTYYDAIRTLLPKALQLRISSHYQLGSTKDLSGLSQEESNLVALLLHARSTKEFDSLLASWSTPKKRGIVKSLLEKNVIERRTDVKPGQRTKTIRMVKMTEEYSREGTFNGTRKQRQVVARLLECSPMEMKSLCCICGVTSSVIYALRDKGVVTVYDAPLAHTPAKKGSLEGIGRELSEKQQAAYDRIAPHIENDKAKCFLLHGVTGSGKTAVFEKLIARTLELGKSALLLIPEISLTPQMANRFVEQFGERIVVVHSGLSLGERKTAYERAKRGDADVVIGTRSAVFTPMPQLGLIIMDEEGESSYQSDQAPRFHTLQVARFRCQYHGAVLVPSSATPSLESYYHAEQGIYELVTIDERYGNVSLPTVEIVDMVNERSQGNDGEFSEALTVALRENIANGEQSILLLNRRGYHTVISCTQCNRPIECPNCSVAMTYHKSDSLLHCHYCGVVQALARTCPSCGGEPLRRMGFGTQRLEDELAQLLPKARLLRMDADTVTSRYAYEEKFEAFRKGEYDIMLGTQMIGKGLDFPNVTLVGVMSIDKALYSGDFRSYEKTFSLVTQVVGRSGRGEKKGRAVLQTFVPDHYVLRLASHQNYLDFYREEITLRRVLLYPPFCDLCVIGIIGDNEQNVQRSSNAVVNCMREEIAGRADTAKLPLRVLGPMPFAYERLKGNYRYRILIKCKDTTEFRSFLRAVLLRASTRRETARTRIYVDQNGNELT